MGTLVPWQPKPWAFLALWSGSALVLRAKFVVGDRQLRPMTLPQRGHAIPDLTNKLDCDLIVSVDVSTKSSKSFDLCVVPAVSAL
ncbi:hypothetical protein BHM03_00046289 [Ensete ventricosum]|uniref:Uncharacterized protein n=1 Tax=Ensete ventricosum TaxID=4639 RepID=A0A426XM66_ENSVE|nr:hypothetical protein B296_00040177 [Ensete ventricosum]RZS14585.1 hypothetical protein BHM03_00046289 [Ensete ventricosum]